MLEEDSGERIKRGRRKGIKVNSKKINENVSIASTKYNVFI